MNIHFNYIMFQRLRHELLNWFMISAPFDTMTTILSFLLQFFWGRWRANPQEMPNLYNASRYAMVWLAPWTSRASLESKRTSKLIIIIIKCQNAAPGLTSCRDLEVIQHLLDLWVLEIWAIHIFDVQSSGCPPNSISSTSATWRMKASSWQWFVDGSSSKC